MMNILYIQITCLQSLTSTGGGFPVINNAFRMIKRSENVIIRLIFLYRDIPFFTVIIWNVITITVKKKCDHGKEAFRVFFLFPWSWRKKILYFDRFTPFITRIQSINTILHDLGNIINIMVKSINFPDKRTMQNLTSNFSSSNRIERWIMVENGAWNMSRDLEYTSIAWWRSHELKIDLKKVDHGKECTLSKLVT